MTNYEIKKEIISIRARLAILEALISPPRKEPKKRSVKETDYTEEILSKLYKNGKTHHRSNDQNGRATRKTRQAQSSRTARK